jgi:hypothetical protein
MSYLLLHQAWSGKGSLNKHFSGKHWINSFLVNRTTKFKLQWSFKPTIPMAYNGFQCRIFGCGQQNWGEITLLHRLVLVYLVIMRIPDAMTESLTESNMTWKFEQKDIHSVTIFAPLPIDTKMNLNRNQNMSRPNIC